MIFHTFNVLSQAKNVVSRNDDGSTSRDVIFGIMCLFLTYSRTRRSSLYMIIYNEPGRSQISLPVLQV